MAVTYSTPYTTAVSELEPGQIDRFPQSVRDFIKHADALDIDIHLIDKIHTPRVVLATLDALSPCTPLDEANARWADDYGQGTAVETIWHSTQSWCFDPMLPPEPDVLDDILKVLDAYKDYPVFDEDELGRVEMEWFDEYVWSAAIEPLPLTDDEKLRLANTVQDGIEDCWVAHEGYLDLGAFRALVREMFGLDLDDN